MFRPLNHRTSYSTPFSSYQFSHQRWVNYHTEQRRHLSKEQEEIKEMEANRARQEREERKAIKCQEEKQAIKQLIKDAGECHLIKALAALSKIYRHDSYNGNYTTDITACKTFPDVHETSGAFIAYTLAECVFMDVDFLYSKAIDFTHEEKTQLIFIFLSYGYTQDKDHFLLRRVINAMNDNLSDISKIAIPEVANSPLYYVMRALYPELLIKEMEIECKNINDAYSQLRQTLYSKLNFLLTCTKKYPAAKNLGESVELYYTNLLKDKHKLMLTNSHYFSRSKIQPDATLDNFLDSATREDKKTRSRKMLLDLGWFSENNKKLNINENAPAVIKLAWKCRPAA